MLLFILINLIVGCTLRYDLACCKEDCPFCGRCGNSSYEAFEENCCSNFIMKQVNYCNETAPPCILQIQLNNLNRFINFFKDEKLYIVIPVGVGIGLMLLFVMYCWFIFGDKKPPLKYKHIK